jgi:hypothetical protein
MKYVVMEFRVRFLPDEWVSVPCECCLLSGAGFCDGPILLPEKSNQVCVCVRVCVFVSLSVIRYNKNSLHLEWVCRRGQTDKGSKKENKPWWKDFLTCRVSFDMMSHIHETSKWLELCWMTSATCVLSARAPALKANHFVNRIRSFAFCHDQA